MRNLFNKVKERTIIIWQSVRNKAAPIWQKVKPYGGYLVSLLLLLIIGLTAYSIFAKKKDIKTPEIAQLKPSIGEPLAPDVNPNVNENTSGRPNVANNSQVAQNTPPFPSYKAPKTGVDDSQPVPYENGELKFRATLPAGTQVKESSDGIIFTSKQGQTYYAVSTAQAGKESLQSIEGQLRNSPNVKNISKTNINGQNALSFNTTNAVGFAFIKDGKIYYLIGKKYLETFQTI